MEKMKALIYHEFTDDAGQIRGKVELKEIDKPVCNDDGCLLRVDVASICGGDVDTLNHGGRNHKIFDGMELGHEGGCTVVEVGKNVTDWKVGDKVWPFPYFITSEMGVKAGACGTFSEYILAENCKPNFALFSTEGLSDVEASLIEPFTIGFHAAMRTQPGPGKNALVFGAGCIGLSAAICCKWKGCDKVAVVGRRKDKLAVAEALGFKTFSMLDDGWHDQVRDYFGAGRAYSGQAANVNCCVEATTNDDSWVDIIPLCNFGCKIAAVSSHEKDIHFNGNFLAFAELEIYGSGGQRFNDATEVIECMRSKQFDIEKVVGKFVTQADFMEGVELMKSGKIVKACVDFTGKYA